MKISEIIPYVLNEDLEKEFFFSQWEYSNRKICIVKIICDNGIVGWGEAYGPAPVVKESVNYIKQNIIGMNPLESDVIWSTLFRRVHDYGRSGVFVSAISAIDIALWDIKGKYHKLPQCLLYLHIFFLTYPAFFLVLLLLSEHLFLLI